MKKYELYELQPEVDNFVCDVNDIAAAVDAAVEYFTAKFRDLIVEGTINHQASEVNNQVKIEVSCLTNQGYTILDSFQLKKRNPFRDIFVSFTETDKNRKIFVSKGFHVDIY